MAPLPAVSGDQALVGSGRCASCSSPLAADQLFCLSCGTRRRDARIAFRDVLATEAAPVVAMPPGGGWPPTGGGAGLVPAGAQGPIGPGRITYVPFIATLGLLLFALGIGVWIGRKPLQAVAAPAAAVPAQVVAATTPVTTTPAEDAAASDDSSKDDAKTDEAATDDAVAPVKDDTSALSSLDKLSPEEYAKQAQKLPSEVGTGGTPPPKDNKPAGGGSETETFN